MLLRNPQHNSSLLSLAETVTWPLLVQEKQKWTFALLASPAGTAEKEVGEDSRVSPETASATGAIGVAKGTPPKSLFECFGVKKKHHLIPFLFLKIPHQVV